MIAGRNLVLYDLKNRKEDPEKYIQYVETLNNLLERTLDNYSHTSFRSSYSEPTFDSHKQFLDEWKLTDNIVNKFLNDKYRKHFYNNFDTLGWLRDRYYCAIKFFLQDCENRMTLFVRFCREYRRDHLQDLFTLCPASIENQKYYDGDNFNPKNYFDQNIDINKYLVTSKNKSDLINNTNFNVNQQNELDLIDSNGKEILSEEDPEKMTSDKKKKHKKYYQKKYNDVSDDNIEEDVIEEELDDDLIDFPESDKSGKIIDNNDPRQKTFHESAQLKNGGILSDKSHDSTINNLHKKHNKSDTIQDEKEFDINSSMKDLNKQRYSLNSKGAISLKNQIDNVEPLERDELSGLLIKKGGIIENANIKEGTSTNLIDKNSQTLGTSIDNNQASIKKQILEHDPLNLSDVKDNGFNNLPISNKNYNPSEISQLLPGKSAGKNKQLSSVNYDRYQNSVIQPQKGKTGQKKSPLIDFENNKLIPNDHVSKQKNSGKVLGYGDEDIKAIKTLKDDSIPIKQKYNSEINQRKIKDNNVIDEATKFTKNVTNPTKINLGRSFFPMSKRSDRANKFSNKQNEEKIRKGQPLEDGDFKSNPTNVASRLMDNKYVTPSLSKPFNIDRKVSKIDTDKTKNNFQSKKNLSNIKNTHISSLKKSNNQNSFGQNIEETNSDKIKPNDLVMEINSPTRFSDNDQTMPDDDLTKKKSQKGKNKKYHLKQDSNPVDDEIYEEDVEEDLEEDIEENIDDDNNNYDDVIEEENSGSYDTTNKGKLPTNIEDHSKPSKTNMGSTGTTTSVLNIIDDKNKDIADNTDIALKDKMSKWNNKEGQTIYKTEDNESKKHIKQEKPSQINGNLLPYANSTGEDNVTGPYDEKKYKLIDNGENQFKNWDTLFMKDESKKSAKGYDNKRQKIRILVIMEVNTCDKCTNDNSHSQLILQHLTKNTD